MGRNLWFLPGEVDLLFRSSDGSFLLIVEVRGRSHDRFRPVRFLSVAKVRRLRRLARLLTRRYRKVAKIQFCEIIGEPESGILRSFVIE